MKRSFHRPPLSPPRTGSSSSSTRTPALPISADDPFGSGIVEGFTASRNLTAETGGIAPVLSRVPPLEEPPAPARVLSLEAVPRRKDEPILHLTRRGNKAKAMAVAEHSDALAIADAVYLKDIRAASSAAPSDSLLKTWTELHVKRFGTGIPVVPLTPWKIHGVAALLKAGGYRSASNYFSRIKDFHIESREPWSEFLAQAIHKATMSTTRGIGPSRQTADLDLGEVASLDISDEPLVEEGPVGPRELAVVDSLFCKREIESSLAFVTHFKPDMVREELEVTLPTSKKDPQALGTKRTWGCLCETGADGRRKFGAPCAFHSWILHRSNLVARFGDDEGNLPANLRAFPSSEGKVVAKEKIVQTAEQLAILTGRPILSESGDRLYGGHVWRISGARHLASINISLWLIMLIARWAGKTIMRYVAEAPLKRITLEYRSKYCESKGQDQLLELKESVRRLQDQLGEVESEPSSSSGSLVAATPLSRRLERMDSVDEFRSRLRRKMAPVGPPLEVGSQLSGDVAVLRARMEEMTAQSGATDGIINTMEANVSRLGEELKAAQARITSLGFPSIILSSNRVAHRPTVAGLGTPVRDWKCACGWEFGLSEYSPAVILPPASKDVCTTCFPVEKRNMREAEAPHDEEVSTDDSEL